MYLKAAESERLYIRPLTINDVQEWSENFINNEAFEKYFPASMNEGTPEEASNKWILKQFDRYNNQNGLYALVEKNSGKLVGQCGLLKQEVNGKSEFEIGYHILPKYQKMGYATEAAVFFKEYGFKNNIADTIISLIHPENIKSQNVAKKNGMHLDSMGTHHNKECCIFRINQADAGSSI